MKPGQINRIIIVLVIIFSGSFATAFAQNKTTILWGLENGLPKYVTTKYNRDYFYIQNIGSVPTTKGSITNWNFAEDLNFFIRIDKNKWDFKFTGGLFSEKQKLNTSTISVDFKSYDVYSKNAGIRLGTAIGYKLLGKRAAQLYLSAGVNYDAAKFETDVNPVNMVINNFLNSDAASKNIYGQSVTPLYKSYYIPPMGVTSALDLHLYRNIFSVIGEYKSKDLGFANNTGKEALYENSYLIKLQWAIVLGYKYK